VGNSKVTDNNLSPAIHGVNAKQGVPLNWAGETRVAIERNGAIGWLEWNCRSKLCVGFG